MAAVLTIDELPNEILQLILSKLSLPDRKSARLVNRHWLSNCNTANLTKNELLRLPLKDLLNVKITRGHLNLKIFEDKPDFDTLYEVSDEFWVLHGESLRSLKVINSRLPYPVLDKLIDHCSNITTLKLSFIDYRWRKGPYFDFSSYFNSSPLPCDNINPKLESLTSLSLSGNPSFALVTVAGFSRLAESAPNLKRLKVMNAIEDSYVEAVITLISKQTLNELIISHCKFRSDRFLQNALELIGPQLTILNLSWLILDTLDCLTEHARLPNLKSLNLNAILTKEPNSLNWLERFPNLEFISFCSTPLQENDLIHLDQLEHLKGLNIRDTGSRVDKISKCFGGKMWPYLIALQLDTATDALLSTILPKLPNLKFLDLNSSEITDLGVHAIIENCPNLTHLDLTGCSKIVDVINRVSINSLKNLVYLNLNDCYQLNSSNIVKLSFNKLRTIGLRRISFSKVYLKELLKNCGRLKRVFVLSVSQEHLANWDVPTHLFDYRDVFEDVTIFDFM